MDDLHVVVVGASAGGIEALNALLAGTPADLQAAILIVLHMPPSGGTSLARILDRAGPLPATAAIDGERLRPSHVYVCVPDHHLVVAGDHLHLRRGPRENGHRPAADPLFRSAARYHESNVIGVVLSGTLTDATAGLRAVRRHGGTAIIQDPADALYDGMPTYALAHVGADYVESAHAIGPLLEKLVRRTTTHQEGVVEVPDPELMAEVAVMEGQFDVVEDFSRAEPSEFPCPDCGGVLWSIEDTDGVGSHFRCRVGHAWEPQSLLAVQDEQVETALWTALRSLQDRRALHERLAERAEEFGHVVTASRYRVDQGELEDAIATLSRMLGIDDRRESEPLDD